MSIFKQKTIKKPITFKGVGLHSGKNVKMKILPAGPNSGVVFKRIDLEDEKNLVYPDIFNVSSAVLCTTISNDKSLFTKSSGKKV